jgi:hypothetical protein
MFSRAYLEELGNGKLRREEALLKGELEKLGVPVLLFTAKRILRRQLLLDASTFIAGDMDAMHGAMQQLGIEVPAPLDYPASLRALLRRKVWPSTLGELERRMFDENGGSVFAKPADRGKNFTGRVFESPDDFRLIGGASRRQKVWCSQPVEWAAEFRVYVVATEIAGIDCYAGEASATLDREVIEGALMTYRESGEAPAAYGIDFGVLSSGETALVEVNDGYSLGAYQIGAQEYSRVIFARWKELLARKGE